MAAAGRPEEAASRYRESLRLNEADAALHNDLGAMLAKLGRFREAVPEFETALRLDPLLDTAKRNLQEARDMLERRAVR
jgi:Flp pilus assembly protein TadD